MWPFRKREKKRKKVMQKIVVGLIIGGAITSIVGKKMLDKHGLPDEDEDEGKQDGTEND